MKRNPPHPDSICNKHCNASAPGFYLKGYTMGCQEERMGILSTEEVDKHWNGTEWKSAKSPYDICECFDGHG